LNSVPRKSFFEKFACLSDNDLEKERLIELSDVANIDDLYCYRPKRTIIEVMQDFSCPNKTPNPIKYPSGYTEFSLKSNLPITPSTHFQDTRTFPNHSIDFQSATFSRFIHEILERMSICFSSRPN